MRITDDVELRYTVRKYLQTIHIFFFLGRVHVLPIK